MGSFDGDAAAQQSQVLAELEGTEQRYEAETYRIRAAISVSHHLVLTLFDGMILAFFVGIFAIALLYMFF